MELFKLYWLCALVVEVSWTMAVPVPGGIVFPDDSRRKERKLEEVITPPVLPVLAHLENDPSTLLPHERDLGPRSARPSNQPSKDQVKPRFGFSNGFDVSPNRDGGVTATFSNGYSGFGGNSQAASHSFSVGFNNGFQASQAASHSNSFSNNNGLLSSSFAGSQASSQASSFSGGINGISASAAAASASAVAGNGISSPNSQSAGFGTSFNGNTASGSQSASSAFGSGNSGFQGNNFGNQPTGNGNFGEGVIDIRHRAGNTNGHRVATSIVFPGETSRSRYSSSGRPQEISAVTYGDNRWQGRANTYHTKNDGDWLAILVSD